MYAVWKACSCTHGEALSSHKGMSHKGNAWDSESIGKQTLSAVWMRSLLLLQYADHWNKEKTQFRCKMKIKISAQRGRAWMVAATLSVVSVPFSNEEVWMPNPIHKSCGKIQCCLSATITPPPITHATRLCSRFPFSWHEWKTPNRSALNISTAALHLCNSTQWAESMTAKRHSKSSLKGVRWSRVLLTFYRERRSKATEETYLIT